MDYSDGLEWSHWTGRETRGSDTETMVVPVVNRSIERRTETHAAHSNAMHGSGLFLLSGYQFSHGCWSVVTTGPTDTP